MPIAPGVDPQADLAPDIAPEPPVSPVTPVSPSPSSTVSSPPVTDGRGIAVTPSSTTSPPSTSTAASGDTWGIPGPTFLAYYGGAIVAAIVLAKITKRLLSPRPDRAIEHVNHLGVYETAGLNAGPKLIAHTAVTRLQRVPMAVPVGPDGQPAGQAYIDESKITHPVERAVLALWRSQPGISLIDLTQRAESLPEVQEVMASLRQRGFLLSSGRRNLLRLRFLWPAAVVTLGAARLQAGLANGKAVGFLAGLVAFAVLVMLLTLTAPQRSPRGQKLLRDAARVTTLRDMTQSALASRVPLETTTLLGMAVFGTALLWESDPALAGAMAAPRSMGVVPTMSSGSDGGSDSGGSSCGGSSCGGGCGGGGCGG